MNIMDRTHQRRRSMELSPKKRLPMQQDLFLRRLNSDILDDDMEFPQCSTPPLAESSPTSPSFRRMNSEHVSAPIRQRSFRRLASMDSSDHFNLSTHGRDMFELSTSTHSPDIEQGPQGPRSPILRRLSSDLSTAFQNLRKAPQSDMHFERHGSLSKTKKRKNPKIKIRIIGLALVMLVLGVLYMEIQFITSAYIDFDQSIEEEVTLQELRIAKYQMDKAREQSRLKSLGDIDREKYTVRINTWRRNNQLIAVIKHYETCPNVAQIQVVWCDEENKPPAELYHQEDEKLPKIIVERHAKNSLNERFRMSEDTKAMTPTLGILSVDDDVTRPCETIDAGFYKWTDIPDRILGFDYRVHMITEDHRDDRLDTNPIWAYGYLSSTQMRNQYSITLPRFSFIHRDYFDLYTKFAPQRVISMVDTHTNCEDIAMSFFVSALTHGKVPRLADFWAAMPSMVKLHSPKAISETDDHKRIRDECVDKFAFLYGLKDGYKALTDGKVRNTNNVMEDLHSFSSKKLFHDSLFELGDDAGYESYIVLKGFNKGRKELALQLSDWINNQEQSKQKIPFQHVYMKLKSQMKRRGF